MPPLLQFFILLPLFAFFVGLLFPPKKEKLISGWAIATVALHLGALFFFLVYWLVAGVPVLDIKHLVFFKTDQLEIFIDFYFDKTTAVYAFVGSVLTLLVARFSRFYLHREEGYKRYFTTLLLFFLGYNLIVFAGNFETLFIGWEILGICSFLLIAFYRDRYLPVKNGMKMLSVYRLGDVFLILAMWMSHQLWHQNITFFQLTDPDLVQRHLQQHNGYSVFIGLVIVLAAAVKSAQLPFSSWLPRAMEGPTTSSAIFYGSLSVHLGVFLLLRTYPYWESLTGIKILVIVIGFATSLIAASIAQVQSSVKTQIAYASITQIGFMFIEVAAGFHVLALIHFAGNAFLRTYQLLVSPSVLSYLIHDMVFSFKPRKQANTSTPWHRVKNTFYILSIKEWNLDSLQYRFLWSPFKWIGTKLHFLTAKVFVAGLVLFFPIGIYCSIFPQRVPAAVSQWLPFLFSVTGLLLVLKSFAERLLVKRAWLFVLGGQLFITLSIALYREDFGPYFILIYLSGVVVCWLVGYGCLKKLETLETGVDLNGFHGHVYEHPKLAFVFLIACLGLAGLPFTPTFIGIDLIFSHIRKQEFLLILSTALSFIFIELAVLRIYARVFMGQHKKTYHPIAYRSS